MFDESVTISAKTWTRTIEDINKVGYSDGVVDGENNSFQTSFNMGYSQGLKFGLKLGYKSAMEQRAEIENYWILATLTAKSVYMGLEHRML